MLTAILLIGLLIVAIALGWLLRVWASQLNPDPDYDDDYDPDDDPDDWAYEDDAPWNVFQSTQLMDASGWLRGLNSVLSPPTEYETYLASRYTETSKDGDWLVNQLIDWWEWKMPIQDEILGWHEELTGERIS